MFRIFAVTNSKQSKYQNLWKLHWDFIIYIHQTLVLQNKKTHNNFMWSTIEIIAYGSQANSLASVLNHNMIYLALTKRPGLGRVAWKWTRINISGGRFVQKAHPIPGWQKALGKGQHEKENRQDIKPEKRQ